MRRCPVCKASFRGDVDQCPNDGADLIESEADPMVGQVLGGTYQLLELIDKGGMSQVYRAEHVRIRRPLAVKVLFGDLALDPRTSERFRREAEALSRILHDNVVSVLDFGATPEGMLFLVMELIEGVTLRRAIKGIGPFPPDRAISIARQVARGLMAIHAQGLVHRDLKPQNVILIDGANGTDHAKIVDFGIVWNLEDDDEVRLTTTGIVLGTPGYMSPEHAAGLAVDARTDLYSLGVILFEMLSGHRPFEGAADLRSGPYPPGLPELVERLLSRRADQRPATAGEVVDALDAFTASDRTLGSAPTVELPHLTAPAGQVRVGSRLADRFRLQRCLGEGGMGVVFEAFDEKREEHVALKTLNRIDPSSIYRLKREFRALADLIHPNLVRLHELFGDDRLWFFTMTRVEGVPFLEYVRRRARESPPKVWQSDLRAVLGQLVDGVAAIHAAEKVHRDLKPSNVLVDREGRLTILDFGLVQSFGTKLDMSAELPGGTPAYLAPEQLGLTGAGPPADVYAMGVMLYEALTGHLPYVGAASVVLGAKISGRVPEHPTKVAQNVPEDLADLALRMLVRQPEERPSLEEISNKIGSTVRNPSLPRAESSSPALSLRPIFVGREWELARIKTAFERVHAGSPAVVHVHGSSGIGKTALLDHALGTIRASGGVVLSGRCHERELMPFKALDAIVDALSRHLRALDRVEAARLTPREASELCRVFPVLARVPELAEAASHGAARADPHEVRHRAFLALKEILARISARQPLAVAIDDLQWGDLDSGAFLTQLFAPPDPPRMLLVLSYRTEEIDHSPLLRMLREHLTPDHGVVTETIALDALDVVRARELAAEVLAGSRGKGVSDELASRIADEARGSPFFIAELARASAEKRDVTLADVVDTRLADIPPSARTLLEIVALAGGPVARDAALRAAGLDKPDDEAIMWLRASWLLRSGSGQEDTLETYHDRIRETLVAKLPPERARAHHLALAKALSLREEPPAEALALHYREAGLDKEARDWALKAAERAAEALAFDRAVAHLRVARGLTPQANAEERRAVERKLGEALANAGHGSEAADFFLSAARSAPEDEAQDLERRAAYELVSCGDIERGMVVTRRIMSKVGVYLPRSPRVALVFASLFYVFFYLIRRWRKMRPPRNAPDERELRRIDVGQAMSIALPLVQGPPALYIGAVSIFRAMRAGEPKRIALGYFIAVWASVAIGAAEKRTAEAIAIMRRIGEETDDQMLLGCAELAEGIVGFSHGKWRHSLASCEKAEGILRRCSGVAAPLHNARAIGTWSLFCLGEIRAFADRTPMLAMEARARGNLWALNSVASAYGPAAFLARDQVETASREADNAFSQWPVVAFQVQHYWYLLARGLIDLYLGEGPRLEERMERSWPALRGSGALFATVVRFQLIHLRAAGALCAAAADPKHARAGAQLGAAERHANTLRGVPVLGSVPMARVVWAGVARVRGDGDRVLKELETAAGEFESAEMPLYAAAARRTIGKLKGGAGGAELVQESEKRFKDQGIVDVPRFSRMLVPIGGDL